MILHFRHKGLRRLYMEGDRRRLPPEHVARIERILARLDVAATPAHMDLPGYRLHALKGEFAGCWAVSVSRNWRIIFRFQDEHAIDVNLLDYH